MTKREYQLAEYRAEAAAGLERARTILVTAQHGIVMHGCTFTSTTQPSVAQRFRRWLAGATKKGLW